MEILQGILVNIYTFIHNIQTYDLIKLLLGNLTVDKLAAMFSILQHSMHIRVFYCGVVKDF